MLVGLGRLLRISLAPSAAADVVAGLLFASGGAWPAASRAWWLVPASLGVYHGALALNDWNDREHDARTRPARPIPARAIAPAAALALGLGLVGLGLGCAALAAPSSALWMGVVAALALAYDFAGRGPVLGPLLLAACRALNLGSGVFFVARLAHAGQDGASLARAPLLELFWLFWPCAAYGLYVFLVARLGRMEDAEDARPLGRRPSVLLWCAALVLFLPLASPPASQVERGAPLALALLCAYGLARTAALTHDWTRPKVERAMGLCLRRLLVFAAIVTLLRASLERADAWLAALAILAGYGVSHALRRVFPPS